MADPGELGRFFYVLRIIDHFPADIDHFPRYIDQLEGDIGYFPAYIDHFPRYMVISGPLMHTSILSYCQNQSMFAARVPLLYKGSFFRRQGPFFTSQGSFFGDTGPFF